MGRRRILQLGGVSAAALALGTGVLPAEQAYAAPKYQNNPFSLGVASGDPLPDGVVLWTRLAPDPLAEDGHGGMPLRPVPVQYEVAEDEAFRRVVRRGNIVATPELGHSVHAEVGGLRPRREYFYRFRTGDADSPVGRTKTAPARHTPLASMALAFASCQAWPDGFFTAYRHMAAEDLDIVVHLGDYIYEYGIPANGGARKQTVPDHFATETVSLARYRTQYALYKTDPDLQAAHAAFPWIVTLDDHEVENNWSGQTPEGNTPTPRPDQFLERRTSAFRAYYENLPLRSTSVPTGPDMRLYRRFTFGDLAEFNVLDTRQYRSPMAAPDTDERFDPARTLTGGQQEKWLLDGMTASRSRWNVLAQQIRVAQFDHGSETDPALPKDGWEGFGMDSWDGYVASRDRIFGGIAERGVSNPVVLTGDWHRNLVADIKADYRDPNSRTIASELVGTSISSGGNGQDIDNLGRAGLAVNPHVKFYNIQRGYVSCRLDAQSWRSDFKVLPSVTTPDAPVTTRATYVIEDGRPGAELA
ncbi:alkaline phosphatase [Streptomyces sp. NWU339]|uniref:alkaline phosphatase D family protein n=1 Tax=Streptomyces sp. NWU339 TaxID=2185284 RepID=UPI000D683309|nr:alkaline phosphatase [Streptomyces sp. NWU339]